MGLTADKIGPVNFSIIACSTISILIFAFWINATTFASLIVLSLLLALIIGVGSSIAQALTAIIIYDPKHLPAAWSGVNIVMGCFSLAAEVIALSMRDKHSIRPYLHTQIFTGCCFTVCVSLLLLIWEHLVRRMAVEHTSEKKKTRLVLN